MKVTSKKLSDGKVHIEATATAQEVDDALNQAKVQFAYSMGVQPESSKTVDQVCEEKMGIKDLNSIVEPNVLEVLVPIAIDKQSVMPSLPPKGKAKSPLKAGKEFAFAFDIEPKPSYELKSYDPVEISIPEFHTDDSYVDTYIDELAGRYAAYEADPDADTSKPLEEGDSVKISMKAFEDGKELKGLMTDGRTYVVGEGYMPEGFDENIKGMKVGETKEFAFEGPGFDENMNECTQKVQATVTILEKQRVTKPVIDDAWVKANMPMYASLQAFRDDIARNIDQQGRENYEMMKRQMAATELAKRFEGSISDEVYVAMRDNLIKNMMQDLRQQGKTWEQFLEENGGEQQVGMMLMLQVREMLVQGYALDALFRHEKMSLTDEDILEACRSINPGLRPEQIRKQFEQTGRGFALRESAERLKANKWLVDHANITYTKPEAN